MRLLILFIGILAFCSCSSVGPKSLPKDRFDYNTAISTSWKQQTLLNIVKLRYADMPLFVEVASIVSGKTLEGTVNMGGTFSSENAVQGDFFSMGTTGKYSDRPTVTYVPITGDQFNKSFMRPISPKVILFLIQSGWPADRILELTVDAMNGYRSRVSGGANARSGDNEFYRVAQLIREVQKSGALSMRIEKGANEKETTVLFFHSKNISDQARQSLKEINDLLGLEPKDNKITTTYGFVPTGTNELAMLTRSMMQIMIGMATEIEVPKVHVDEKRTVPTLALEEGHLAKHLVAIKSSKEEPEFGFVSVKYRDYWYYIDDRDMRSKGTFAFLMVLFSVMEAGEKDTLPLVTIRAN